MMGRVGHGHRGFRPAGRDVDGGDGGFRRRRGRREAAEANEAGLAAPAAFVPVEVVATATVGADTGNRRGEGGTIDIDVGSGRVTIRGAADPALAPAIVSALRG